MQERISIYSLDEYGVTIQRQKYVEIDEVSYDVGLKHSISYANDAYGRTEIKNNEPKEVVSSVMAIWGTEPKIKN